MLLAIISCSKEEKIVSEEEFAESLSFDTYNYEASSLKGDPIVIMEWDEIGRASKYCKAIGLCNVDWFPQSGDGVSTDDTDLVDDSSVLTGAEISNKSATIENSEYNYSAPIKYNSENDQYYVDILLSAQYPEVVPVDLYPFRIDESIILESADDIGFDLIIPEGKYYFDSSLGTYGGYEIILEH